jgi:Flp pilus assembly protein TadG
MRLGDDRGGALVETALVLPLLLLVLTGILYSGLALNNFQVLTNAVNISAQVLAVSRGQIPTGSTPCAVASTAIDNAAPGLVAASISLSFVINGSAYTPGSCAGGTASMVQGASTQITATYPCTLAVYGLALSCSLKAQTAELIQ